jgi:hypothetical protein
LVQRHNNLSQLLTQSKLKIAMRFVGRVSSFCIVLPSWADWVDAFCITMPMSACCGAAVRVAAPVPALSPVPAVALCQLSESSWHLVAMLSRIQMPRELLE